jgi:TonB family protein
MTMSDLFAASPFVRAIGVALVEFVWQGALIAVMASAALRVLRGSDPATRYAVSLLTLLAMAAVPIATGVLAYQTATAPTTVVADAAAVSPAISSTVLPASGLTTVLARDQWMPAIVLIWAVGVSLSSLHLAVSWLMVGIVRRGASRLSREAQRQLAVLAARLGIRRCVHIAESAHVAVPTVMGWMRPLILVPASTLAGLSPKQLEAILVHELAHVRRHDYIVNVVQSVIETLLFYHPAVWWMSRRIRAERELCCDDLVVSTSGDRLTYARALAELEAHRLRTPALAVAANGGDLMHRITRLLGTAPADRSATSIGGVLAVLLALPLIVIGQAAAGARPIVPEVSAPAVMSPPEPALPATMPPVDVSRSDREADRSVDSIQSRYGTLVDRYRSVVLALAAQNAQPREVVPSQPSQSPAPQQGSSVDEIGVLIRETQALIRAGRLQEASALLTQLEGLVARLPEAPRRPTSAPPAPPPPPPAATPPVIERAGANSAQGVAASNGDTLNPLQAGAPLRVGGDIAPPTKIRDVRPIYPADAKDAGIQGVVILECVIDPNGNVADVKVLRGHPSLIDAAIQAVRQWQYTTTTFGGKPVSLLMTVTVNFTLE